MLDEIELEGGLSLFRLILSEPELRLIDLCNGATVNRAISHIDKRPSVKQCDQNGTVSFGLKLDENLL